MARVPTIMALFLTTILISSCSLVDEKPERQIQKRLNLVNLHNAEPSIEKLNKNTIDRLPHISDPFRPDRDLSMLGCFTSKERVADGRNAEIVGKSLFIENKSELTKLRKRTVDVDARGSYGVASAEASYSRTERYSEKISNNRVIWAIDINIKYPEIRLAEFDLSDKGVKTLSQAVETKDPEYFYQRCGREFRSSYVKGATIQLIYNFQASSAEKAKEIKTDISASGSYAGVGSASGSVSTLDKLTNIDNKLKIALEIRQSGFQDGDPHLGEILAIDIKDLPTIRGKVLAALKAVDFDSTVVTDSKTQPISDTLPFYLEDRMMLMESLYPVIHEYDRQLFRLEEDIKFVNLMESDFANVDNDHFDATKLFEAKSNLLTLQHRVKSGKSKCYRAVIFSDCALPNERPVVIDYSDFYSGNLVNFKGWKSAGNFNYNRRREAWLGGVSFYPTFDVDASFLVKKATYLTANSPLLSAEGETLNHADGEIFGKDTRFFGYALGKDQVNSQGWKNYCWGGNASHCANSTNSLVPQLFKFAEDMFNKSDWFVEVIDINNKTIRYKLPPRQYNTD